jgi:transcriptional regulator with XRE-family HTH domain
MFANILKQARNTKRWSQLELALRLSVSQRHISFVESGRAKPSRELLLAWLQELQVPLMVQNCALLQAGFAPEWSQASLDSPDLALVNAALIQLIQAHDPMPAFCIDADWNIVHINRGALNLVSCLLPWTKSSLTSGQAFNLLDLLAHPEGLAKQILNLDEVGPAFLFQLRQEANLNPAISEKVQALEARIIVLIGAKVLEQAIPISAAPVLTTYYASPLGELAFFSMFSTFGSPQNISLASLRVEHLFAANQATQALMMQLNEEIELQNFLNLTV